MSATENRWVVGWVLFIALFPACHDRSVETTRPAAPDVGGSGKSTGPGESGGAQPYDPTMAFEFPWQLLTNRSASDEFVIGFGGVLGGYPIFENEVPPDWQTRLKTVLKMKEVETGIDVPYGLEKKGGRPEKIRIKPSNGIQAGKGYRATLDLRHGRPFPKVKVADQYGIPTENVEVAVEFYTYSRPMLTRVRYSKADAAALLDWQFSEALRVAELTGRDRTVLSMDGAPTDACVDPYDRDCEEHPPSHGPYEHDGEMIELTGGLLFFLHGGVGTFSEVSIRLAHAVRGLDGSLLDGASSNRVATVDGDYIVYTIKFADMRETQPGLWEWKY